MLVWDQPTRLFHWLLVLCFAGAYASGESERYRELHLLLGYTAAALVALRLAWGVAGTRYARFSGFVFSLRAALGYARSLLSRAPQHFTGHNPLGSWAVVALLGSLAATCATGIATLLEAGGRWMEEAHEAAADITLALVLVHIAAVVVSSFLHRENLVRAMITGRKPGVGHGAEGNRPLIALALAAAVLAFWAGAFRAPGMAQNRGIVAALTRPAEVQGRRERDRRERGRGERQRGERGRR